ncbi:MAG: PQQ-dependent sugar dehydrogenase [Pyrinomonadaceae bacterium]
MKRWILGAAVIFALAGLIVSTNQVAQADRSDLLAQRPETIASITLAPVLTGLSSPVGVYNAADESNRLFIVERTGKIRVMQPGATTATDFLDVSAKVSLNYVERGLLGLAFHPQYKTNGRFFIYYVKVADGSIQLSEYHVSSGNPNVADTTELPMLNILHPTNLNHNGGTLMFGGDGYLYLGPGDGGSGNDPPQNAQNINELKGKILRLDVDHGSPYTIPATNPFAGATPGADEIWMVGMRNPWRFTFDRANRNKLWIADVGQDAVEEIDSLDITQNPAAGARNGGWRTYEGNTCTGLDPCVFPTNYIPPVSTYANAGSRCSITGGYVYRGRRGTFPLGAYIYADYCTGEIWTLIGTTQTLVLDTDANLTSFGEDEAGEIYACNTGSGLVRRLTESTAVVPRNEIADFDGDLKSDISVYRGGAWYWLNSFTGTFQGVAFGNATDRPTPGDFDGDGKTDLAVWRDTEGVWYIINSGTNTFRAMQFGSPGDLPVQGDYDNDRKADIAVYRPSNNAWYYLNSSNGAFIQIVFGIAGDRPVPGDYNGDGKSDFAIFRPSAGLWSISFNGGGTQTTAWGANGDIPVAADYDADGKTDLAVFRPTGGGWYVLRSSDGAMQSAAWGANGDVPVPGDYDGDDKDDYAIYRAGGWYILRSSDAALKSVAFGIAGDLPIPAAYKPQ